MIPESITVVYNDHVPLEPRIGQTGLRVTAGAVASAPVALPGELGDILSVAVVGDYDVQFRLCRPADVLTRATNADTIVWKKRDLLFLVPSPQQMGSGVTKCHVSVISPDGDSDVVFNTYKRGT